jgi:predicted 2-oxoglutarate/Fe(II)-dependent dioxygenase YbiX
MKYLQHEDLGNGILMYKNIFNKNEEILSMLKDEDKVLWLKNKTTELNDFSRMKNMECYESMNLEIDIEEFSLLERKLMISFALPLNHYRDIYETGFYSYKKIQFLKYNVGHYFGLHKDKSYFNNAFVSVFYYVNDDYEGGEIYFPDNNLLIKPEKNSLIMFPSDLLHEVKKVTNGTKYVGTFFCK